MPRSKSPSPKAQTGKKKASNGGGLNFVWWNPMDPTFLFIVPTLFSILFIEGNEEEKTLSFSIPSKELFIEHITDYAFLVGAIEMAIFISYTRHETRKLSKLESLAANWHLWNGIVTYTMMDGMNGAFGYEWGILPTLHNRGYRMVDRRYRRHIMDQPGGPTSESVYNARVLNGTELFVYSWLSILAAVGIVTKARWHKTIESIVLTMSAFGALLFVLPDYIMGCHNMQPIGDPTCTPPLTPFYFFFVYFGVIINW